jgi:hypothetical protein
VGSWGRGVVGLWGEGREGVGGGGGGCGMPPMQHHPPPTHVCPRGRHQQSCTTHARTRPPSPAHLHPIHDAAHNLLAQHGHHGLVVLREVHQGGHRALGRNLRSDARQKTHTTIPHGVAWLSAHACRGGGGAPCRRRRGGEGDHEHRLQSTCVHTHSIHTQHT